MREIRRLSRRRGRIAFYVPARNCVEFSLPILDFLLHHIDVCVCLCVGACVTQTMRLVRVFGLASDKR